MMWLFAIAMVLPVLFTWAYCSCGFECEQYGIPIRKHEFKRDGRYDAGWHWSETCTQCGYQVDMGFPDYL